MAKQQIQPASKVIPVNNLGRLMNAIRYAERTTLRDQSKEIGISAASLLRIEQGYMPDGQTWTKLMTWIMGSRIPVAGQNRITGNDKVLQTKATGT